MKKKPLVFLFVLGLLITGGILYRSLAQNSHPGLTLHPSNIDLTLTPGSPSSGTIFLMNTTDKVVSIQTRVENFTASGEQGGVTFTNDNTLYSLASWIQVSPEKVDIQPKTEYRFTYTITSPTNAESGGHYGSIIFATVPSANPNGNTQSAISEEIASLILARIPGNAKESAVVESLTTDKKFYEFGPVTFTLRVKNNGTVHIQPFGSVEVTDIFGDKIDAPITQTNVLPNAVRKVTAILPNKLLIGHFTGTIVASYGSKNIPLNGSTEFYAFPIRYGIILFVILVVLFLLRKRLLKALKTVVTGK